ncbi:MAG TPA: family 20 glycosylhydrolase [Candidatus Acidoferrales bacterium]|nr:family 20 glycosylhydrolase [Candidatus Acidoferrales bacterium]
MTQFGIRHVTILLGVLVLTTTALATSQPPQSISVVPLPAAYQLHSGQLLVNVPFSIDVVGPKDAVLNSAVKRFSHEWSVRTGIPLRPPAQVRTGPSLKIKCDCKAYRGPELGADESYQLDVTPGGAELKANAVVGVMAGLQTLLQLVQSTPEGYAIPAISIQDRPRFAWRGLLLDVSRHYMPPQVIKRNLDGMAAVKLNVLHWHLSDREAFRVESKRLPKLHEMGSDGAYYTQGEVRDIVAYARERGIRVVPEFDMPGHSRAWFIGYPKLASGSGPYHMNCTVGFCDPDMDPTKKQTYRILDKVIGEMARLFPDPYFHIGGDEVVGKEWKENAKIQQFARAHGLRNNQDLQVYFNRNLQKIVTKHGKIMMGWDEILRPDLPQNVVVQVWRSQEALAEDVKQGRPGLLSYGYYLDLMWPASRHYAIDPVADGTKLTPEEQARILGGEACMWTEFASPENLDSRLWPRLAAIAERLWSPREVRDADSMYVRLNAVSWRLELLGLTHRSSYELQMRRLAESEDISSLETLVSLLEPVKDYVRMNSVPAAPDMTAPLNRLVDLAQPESETARRFSNLVDRVIKSKAADKSEVAALRRQFESWSENDAKLHPALDRSDLLHEVMPLSESLKQTSEIGLQALNYLEQRQSPPESWRQDQLARLKQAKKPCAHLLLATVPAIDRLVEAAGRQDRAD